MEAFEPAVRTLYFKLLDAWNRRAASDYAALFAPDSLLVGFDGSQVRGSDVEDHLKPIFENHPTAAYVAKVRDLRTVGTGAALLWAIAGMVPPSGEDLNPAVNAVHLMIAEHDGEGWRIVLFQNTPAQYHGRPELAEQHTAELRPLLSRTEPPPE
jgi:uncharacterized protein (TIGR02246 family)